MLHHLQLVHGWSREESRTALVHFGLRKPYSYTSHSKVSKSCKEKGTESGENKTGDAKKKDYHYPHFCPLAGCASFVKRLGPHLKNVHKLDPNSQEFKEALIEARDLETKPCITPDLETLEDFQRGQLSQPSKTPSDSVDTSVCEVDRQNDCACDDSDNDDDDNGTLSEMPKIVAEALIKFHVWLESADGGKLDNKTSTKNAKQVLKLLNVIDEKKELSSLFNHALVNDKSLEGHVKEKYHPKTIPLYIFIGSVLWNTVLFCVHSTGLLCDHRAVSCDLIFILFQHRFSAVEHSTVLCTFLCTQY